MKYRCLIVDDEDLARELLSTHLSHLDQFELVAACPNALEARKILQNQPIDLLFLDIEMPLMKGTDFLRSLASPPKVIFTTAYRNYAVDGFNLNAVDYLLKPILLDRFMQAIDKFLESQNKSAEQIKEANSYLFVRQKHKNVKVFLDEILYVESIKDYVRIHLQTERIMIKFGITAFEKELDNRFLRIHRSFLVNKDKITAFTKKDVEIGDLEIPIGESYKDSILQALS